MPTPINIDDIAKVASHLASKALNQDLGANPPASLSQAGVMPEILLHERCLSCPNRSYRKLPNKTLERKDSRSQEFDSFWLGLMRLSSSNASLDCLIP